MGSGVVSLKGEYKSVVVDLNSQWRTLTDLNVEYDSSSYDAYESFSNHHVANSIAQFTITISGYSQFTIMVMSDGESVFDYIIVYDVDSKTTEHFTTSNKQNKWETVVFEDLDTGTHDITIVYKKDGSYNIGRDKGFVLIPKV